uniref:Glucose-methanol-choline oxidoreductase N-terminal domain-containing protein n=1 Tax=Oryza nivara TaxID=4536 RepID=A0A0E0HRE7_ORYNI
MNQLYEFGGSVRHHDERRRAAPGRIQYGRRRLSGELVGLPQQDARVRAQGVGDQTTHGFPLFASSDYAAAMDKVFERLGVTSGCTEEGLQNKVLRKGVREAALPKHAVVYGILVLETDWWPHRFLNKKIADWTAT